MLEKHYVPVAGCNIYPGVSLEPGQDPNSQKSKGRWPVLPQQPVGWAFPECSAAKNWCWKDDKREMSCFTVCQCVLFFFCLWTHPLSFSLRLPRHEVSSSPLKSFDRKSKLPRTSSTARVSSDDELLNRERSFWRRTPQSIKITHMFPLLVCVFVYMCVQILTFNMVDRCSIWWSRALSSFSEQLWFCSVFSSSAIRTPSLAAWALRWAPLTPGLPWARAAGVGEDGVTAGGWAVGEGESGAE